ncbi:TetR/AcrR family transcriptional regulator [Aureimonas psammosilenae]|uniref:TetR/AcrR family transcriptional regulator n=1 Tax=Aureimonas psammosilenae TaxID=2495496 RepID=UPI00186A4EAA|nr:TetR/AcrR family transcriptional regulator [Aureimonas psammosilenae]
MTALIVGVARQMLLKNGYDNTSIDEIVVQAKISKKTFYARFSDKAQLFEAVCMQIAEERFPDVIPVQLQRSGIQAALEDILIRHLDGLLQTEIIEFERIVASVAMRFPEIAKTVERTKDRIIVGICEVLNEANHVGVLEIDDIHEAAWRLIDGGVTPLFRQASLGLRSAEINADDREALRRYVKFYVRGYGPSPKRPIRSQAE